MLRFKVTGINSVNQDYKAFNTKVYHAAQAGLTAVGSELTNKLRQHIRRDIYNAYSPTSYPRRSDNPAFGEPLDSDDYMDLYVGKMSLMFSYEPQGTHSGVQSDRLDWEDKFEKNYGTNPNAPLVPSPVHGDDLIRRIETGEGYSWNVEMRPRHFWNNFVEEAVGENGWTERVLVKSMNETDRDLGVVSDGQIIRDGNDTVFEQQESITVTSAFDTDDDGELPY